MRIAIHQPHYFPWLGYLDKMAKVDQFMLMDEVQLTDSSNMFRNRFMTKNGDVKYLTVAFQKKGYMEKPFLQVEINGRVPWQKRHQDFLMDNYRKAPYFQEVWEQILPLFEKEYAFLCDVAIDSLLLVKNLFGIPTKLILQSDLEYDRSLQKNELVLALCKAAGADYYLSGNGARKYMKLEPYAAQGVKVVFQTFQYPVYPQNKVSEFVSNLSSLDILFQLGIEGAKEVFWNNLYREDDAHV